MLLNGFRMTGQLSRQCLVRQHPHPTCTFTAPSEAPFSSKPAVRQEPLLPGKVEGHQDQNRA